MWDRQNRRERCISPYSHDCRSWEASILAPQSSPFIAFNKQGEASNPLNNSTRRNGPEAPLSRLVKGREVAARARFTRAGIWAWIWAWAWTWGLTRHLRVRLAVISPSGRAWVGVGVGVGVSVSVAVAGWCGWCVLVARGQVAGAWWPGPGGRSRGGRSRGGRGRGGRGLRAGGRGHRTDSGWWALVCRLGAVGLGCGRGAAGR